jgi:hypothetical protein
VETVGLSTQTEQAALQTLEVAVEVLALLPLLTAVLVALES